jgi:hypothetical protein
MVSCPPGFRYTCCAKLSWACTGTAAVSYATTVTAATTIATWAHIPRTYKPGVQRQTKYPNAELQRGRDQQRESVVELPRYRNVLNVLREQRGRRRRPTFVNGLGIRGRSRGGNRGGIVSSDSVLSLILAPLLTCLVVHSRPRSCSCCCTQAPHTHLHSQLHPLALATTPTCTRTSTCWY